MTTTLTKQEEAELAELEENLPLIEEYLHEYELLLDEYRKEVTSAADEAEVGLQAVAEHLEKIKNMLDLNDQRAAVASV